MADANPYRLPRTVEPVRYELTLTPDIETARFAGEERVRVTVHEPVRQIFLNSAELEIFSAELIDDEGVKLDGTVTLDDETEVATIDLSDTAHTGEWTLHLTFTGILNDKLRGFYRSTFTDDSGNERVIATTQFQATDARRAFPCWDEPDFKAVFAVTLIVDESLAAFSNAAILNEEVLGNGKRQIVFNDTIKMSTYLVAFVVGPLVATDTVDVNGVPLRVACVPGRENLTSFALEAGAAALRYFAEYFKIPYPADKLDLIALPDFAAGAMENLGCVTFRETALLVDTQRASRLEVERVADVVAHEIAHMWFGDLVTMKWWNGIWLNEAFATFMELLFVDSFRPDWERWTSFGLEKSAAFAIDSLSSTRAIEYPVVRPEEAHGMFDVLTYQKGAAVLRMLEQHLGAHEFGVGISKYLHDHEYGNAETTDLWDALEKATEQPVRALMDSWIFQGGHPIVHVEQIDDTNFKLSQRRFSFSGSPDDSTKLWHIPVGIRAMVDNELHHQKLLMVDREAIVSLPSRADWMILNERSNGFFRVSYQSSLLQTLSENVHALDSLERFTLASDTWAACLAGLIDLPDVIGLIKVMRGDDDPNVWGALLTPLRMIDKMIDDDSRPELEAFVREVAHSGYERLGWAPHQGEGERITTLRGVLIGALGTLGNDTEVRAEAQQRFVDYQTDPSALDANLVAPVQVVVAHLSKRDHYEILQTKFRAESSTPQEKVNALQALAAFSDIELVQTTLHMIELGEVRTQDAPYAIRSMLTSRTTGQMVWEWCEENWEWVTSKFPDNSIARMIEGSTAHVDPEFARRVQAFMHAHPFPRAQLSVDQTCERLGVNAAFFDRHKASVATLFD